MGRGPFAITGLGMRCAAGLGAIQSCAAVRAGIARFAEWPHAVVPVEDGVAPVVGAFVVPDPGDGHWIAKFGELAVQPLLESLWMADLSDLVDAGDATRWGVYLSVPSFDRPGVDEEDAAEFLEEVQENTLFPCEPATVSIVSAGHAGALIALGQAMDDLSEGRSDVCAVGGVDSLLHADSLDHLRSEGKLKTPAVPAGLIPGEAGAFVVLETEDHARARGAGILALVAAVRRAQETAPAFGDAPGRADATVRVLREAVADAPRGPGGIARIVNDLNGERWRFLEWAMADARALNALPSERRLWHPADCLGDIGAATGAAHLCIAARAFAGSYAGGTAILVCNASESGERAAAVVFPAEPGR